MLLKKMCMHVAKQVKWLLKNPSVCVFAALALAKAAELQMNAKELTLAYNFAFKYLKTVMSLLTMCFVWIWWRCRLCSRDSCGICCFGIHVRGMIPMCMCTNDWICIMQAKLNCEGHRYLHATNCT